MLRTRLFTLKPASASTSSYAVWVEDGDGVDREVGLFVYETPRDGGRYRFFPHPYFSFNGDELELLGDWLLQKDEEFNDSV